MAIKINNNAVINNDRHGQFILLNAGTYTTAERDSLTNQKHGDFIFVSDAPGTGTLQVWTGSAWRDI